MRTVTSWVIAACLVCASCGAAPAEPRVKVDEKAGTVSLPATVADQGQYDVLKGAIEYLLVAKGGKTYETVFVTDCTAGELLDALKKLGAKEGEPAGDGRPPTGMPVRIFAEYTSDGKPVRRAADEFVALIRTGEPLKPALWTVTGSRETFDPATEKRTLEAAVTGSLIGLHYTDRSPLIQNPRAEAKDENIYAANVKVLPTAGTVVRLVIERSAVEVPAGTRRVHVFLTGRVQGVGFRNFTEGHARRLGLTGWVMNLRDGRVEAVVEGPTAGVAELLEKIKRGPRYARVDKMDVKDEKPTGEFETFSVRYD